ncbi:MAG: hypothetical protein V1882_12155 [Candidatus Omnitrophota bacterium]
MKTTHEERERFYVTQYLNLLGVSNLMVTKGDDPPDVVLVSQDSSASKIAIELTEFHSSVTGSSGKPRRAIEETWDGLLREIREIRKAHPVLNCVSCVICFKGLDLPGKKDHVQFGTDMMSFLADKGGELAREFKEYSGSFKSKLLTKYVSKIIASKTSCNYIEWNWNHSAAGVGLTEEELKAAIGSKIVTSFDRAQFGEVWLMIVSGHEMSQAMGLPNIEELNKFAVVNSMLDKSQFDRVLIFEYMFDRILERKLNSDWIQKKCHPDFDLK